MRKRQSSSRHGPPSMWLGKMPCTPPHLHHETGSDMKILGGEFLDYVRIVRYQRSQTCNLPCHSIKKACSPFPPYCLLPNFSFDGWCICSPHPEPTPYSLHSAAARGIFINLSTYVFFTCAIALMRRLLHSWHSPPPLPPCSSQTAL